MHRVQPHAPRPTTRRRLAGAVALTATAALATACGGSAGGGGAAIASSAPAPARSSPPARASAPAATTPSAASAPAPTTTGAPASATPSGAPAPAGNAAPQPSGTTTAGAPCPTASLRATVGGPTDGAAGTSSFYLYLVNTGRTACTVNGHPGLSYVAGADGHQVGRAADREETGSPVSLVPGATAHARVRVRNPGDFDEAACQPVPVRGFRVYPPDQTASVFVAEDGTACGATGFSLLTVGPVVAGRPASPGAL